MSSLSTKSKLLASVGLLGATAAIAGLGTFGTFTDTTSASTPVDSGVVALELGTTLGTSALTVAATDLVPGDSLQRVFTLSSAGSTDPLSGITLTSTATTSSLLDTDAADGLQMTIQRCSVAWAPDVLNPGTYACVGTTSTVLAERAVVGANLALSNLTSTNPALTDNLRMNLRFPASADNTFQNLASTISFAFTGTQRAASVDN
jgi:spore coat-associated protein N